MNPLTDSAMDYIVPLLLIYKDRFGIKYPTKVDLLWDKKPDQIYEIIISSIIWLQVSNDKSSSENNYSFT